MNSVTKYIINERFTVNTNGWINEKENETNKNILITNKSPTNKKDMFSFNEYSLKQNFFDPSKHSPPNDFMMKLQLRMSIYNSFNNSDNLINE
jgi:hypothetical protein